MVETIRAERSRTKLVSSPDPSQFEQSVTLTATVVRDGIGSGAPTGFVLFLDGSTVLGTVALSGDEATLTTESLSVGTHRIKAIYGGNSGFVPSTSNLRKETVK